MGSSFLLRVVFAFLGSISFGQAATNVLTWHNDAARTGQNLIETQLSPANVNSTNFGKLFQINVDGKVDAQPPIVSNVTSPNKGVHNVVIIATEHDTVYCCDADDGTVLWTASMLKTGEVPSEAVNGCSQVSPEIGVTATPVIDLTSGPHGTIYLTAMSKSGSNSPPTITPPCIKTWARFFQTAFGTKAARSLYCFGSNTTVPLLLLSPVPG